jgi:hypothetical protein
MRTLLTKQSQPAASNPAHPHQFRLPRGRSCDQWFGCNRSFWNERILPTPRNGWNPPIRSRVVRQPGARKAVRFILYDSAAKFFRALDESTAREMEEIRAQHAGENKAGESLANTEGES